MPSPQRPSDLDNLRKLGNKAPARAPSAPVRRRGGPRAIAILLSLALLAAAAWHYWPASTPTPATPVASTAGAGADKPTTPTPTETAIEPTQDAASVEAAVGPFAVTGVEIGTEVDADLRVVMPRSHFGTRETLRASIAFSGDTTGVDLVATWMWVGKGPVARVVQPLDGNPGPALVLTLESSNGWPAGDYALEVSRDGKPLARQEFSFGD